MKKSIHFIILLFLFAAFIASCKDDEKTNEPFTNGSAIINGTAYINLDYTNDTIGILYEKVPTGTTIYAVINSIDLVEFPSGSVNYGDIYYSTQVGANGEFNFTIPANNKAVTVTFSSDDIKATQIQADTTNETKTFNLSTGYSETVHNGVTKLTEVYFSEK
jgi:hypothetical protein